MDKGQKIEELEEEIEKMKKENSEEINTMKYMNDSNIGLIKEERKENNESNEILEIGDFENVIYNLFNKQKIKFLNEVKNIKNEIISEIKEGLKRDDDINNEDLDEILTNINKINSNLKNHNININNIQNDLSNINEKLKDKIVFEDKNKEEKGKNNQNMVNELNNDNNNVNNVIDFYKGDKIYECSNCKNLYCLNECFETKGNKKYNEHYLKPQKPNLEEDINNIKEKEKMIIIEDYIPKKEAKENKEIDNDHINKENEEEDNFEIEMKLSKVLTDYFYKDGKIIQNLSTSKDLNPVIKIYKSLLNNNVDINYIDNYQKNYISMSVLNSISSLSKNIKMVVNNKIKKLDEIINDLKNKK